LAEGSVAGAPVPVVGVTIESVLATPDELPTPLAPKTWSAALKHPGTFKVVYVFAGPERRADLKSHLLSLCKEKGLKLVMKEEDIIRDGKNILDDGHSSHIKAEMRDADMFVTTPPCSTFSRAAWANKLGPGPVRSREHPRGFPWLEGAALTRCTAGNEVNDKALELLEFANEIFLHWLHEAPEDLGTRRDGGAPASNHSSHVSTFS
jgi:hypothetical protein